MPKFSGRPKVYDRDALHTFLYRNTNSRGVVKVNQTTLSEELGCSPVTLRGLLKELILLERIERVTGPGPCAYFRVAEPEKKLSAAPKKRERTIAWG